MVFKNYAFKLIFLLFLGLGFSQDAVLCPSQTLFLKIHDDADVPAVSDDSENNINLIFSEQYITDLFSNYSIYDFYQTFPSSSGEARKSYTLVCNSKALVEDIITNIPNTTIEVDIANFDTPSLPIKTSINPEIIQALSGNTYTLTKYINISESNPCDSCPLNEVPNDFLFKVNFTHDAENELLVMENDELTSCGNSFSISLAGGNPNGQASSDNTLQLWEAISGTPSESDNSQPCHNIEATIFSILDIACPEFNNGLSNISVTVNPNAETVQFQRNTATFGSDIVEFSKANLSIKDEAFNIMKPFKIEGNPYLQISNLDNQPVSVEIFNTSGQQIAQVETFKENTLDISNLTTGLYFIRISNLINQQKVFKLILN